MGFDPYNLKNLPSEEWDKLITKALKTKIEANARDLRLLNSDKEGYGKLPI